MATLPELESWFSDANEALSISLVSAKQSGLQPLGSFHPKFTYSVFGDEEKIFGYKNLKINLRYRASDMRPHVGISYSQILKPPAGVEEPTDINSVLKEGYHLPEVAFSKNADFDSSARQIGEDWTPPGTLHDTIETGDERYEIWHGTMEDPAIKQLNSRVQLLVPLLIEGGSYLGQTADSEVPEELTDGDRWTFFALYRTQNSDDDPEKKNYVFVGYSTVYRFFFFQPATPPPEPNDAWELPKQGVSLKELPCRTRLSQFIILPPFQGKGNGARLYKSIFTHYHKHRQTYEFTVENPNEAFDDLRDACDLAFLKTLPEFNSLKLDQSVSIPKSGPIPQLVKGGEKLEEIRLKSKIAPRQFSRVLEMNLMSQLPTPVRPTMIPEDDTPARTATDKHLEKLWQLIVKQRLYRHNRDILAQIEPAERIEKLEETLTGVELEYARLLAAHDRAAEHTQTQSNGKRKLEETGESNSNKKARV